MTNILLLGRDSTRIIKLLESYHYSMISAENMDSLKNVISKQTSPDIVILMSDFPISDIQFGLSVLSSQSIDSPVIYIKTGMEKTDINRLLLWNVACLLNEPLSRDELIFAVEKAIKGYHEVKYSTDYEKIYLQIMYKFNILADIVKKANSSLDRSTVVESIMQKIEEIIKCEGWSLLLFNREKDRLIFEASKGTIGSELQGKEMPADAGIVGYVIKNNLPVLINDVSKDKLKYDDIDLSYNFNTRSIICIPLKSRGVTIGAIEIVNKKYNQLFDQKDLELLQILSEPAAIALENCFLFEKTKELSLIDDLTKLYNSRYLNYYLEQEIEREKRTKKPISMVFFDIDGFKRINDNYGHLAGSQVISEIGKLLKLSIRKMDIAIRYGGDEFIMLLPETSSENSLILVKRFRDKLNSHIFLENLGINEHLTASFGIATFPFNSNTKEELISNTDTAMYYIKERGKDGIFVFNSDEIIR